MSVRPAGRWSWQLLMLSAVVLGAAACGGGAEETGFADGAGATDREDGSTQLTYNGWPLYYFSGDESAGDTAGQGINDVWFVVGPDGEQIDSQADDTGASGPDY